MSAQEKKNPDGGKKKTEPQSTTKGPQSTVEKQPTKNRGTDKNDNPRRK
ncbi:MAG: hypothetical protein ACTIJ9_01410 [Aequorivita sp.]